jgi:cytochrome c-type biogenesis protein CcmH/NrfG
VLLAQNKPAEALPAYEKALSISKSPELLVKVAQAMTMTGKGKEAQARATQWLKDRPNDALVAMFVADRSLASKEFKPAISLLEGVSSRIRTTRSPSTTWPGPISRKRIRAPWAPPNRPSRWPATTRA